MYHKVNVFISTALVGNNLSLKTQHQQGEKHIRAKKLKQTK